MTPAEFEQWIQENGTAKKNHTANRIDYVFVTLRDGWIAVFQRDYNAYTPLIQAADIPHAESYCYMREPITVPVQRL